MEFKNVFLPDYLDMLLKPEFNIVEDLVLLTAHFSESSLSEWLKDSRYRTNLSKMENTINHVHLDDFTADQEKQKVIGEQIKNAWIKELAESFSHMEFSVYLEQTENGWELCMHSIRNE